MDTESVLVAAFSALAQSLAVILLYAVLFSARRGVTIGRPPGSTALSRLALQVTLRGMRP